MIREMEVALIVRDPELQPRETLNHETITQYAEDMLAGAVFPPVVAYHDGDRYWLSQGFHRTEAAEQAGLETIAVEVREGTRADALWDAVSSNQEHDRAGQRRSNADKRRAVRMAITARPLVSSAGIARQVGVSPEFVRQQRAILQPWQDGARAVAATRNGHPYMMDVSRIGRGREGFEDNPALAVAPPEEPLDGQSSFLDDGDEPEEEEPFALAAAPVKAEAKPTTRATFNQTNEMVDWARWTWNPVTGCEHNCVYCYARDIANRFYPEKFTPTYRPERLDAPLHTRRPQVSADNPVERTAWRNVFVCSMADLFGRWVPQEWIDGVFDSCRQSPEWNYLFLTKFPNRYEGLKLPPTAWVGTSVDEQKRVANAEKAFRKVKAPVKWLSVEPMREPLKFTRLDLFDWVVIGGQSRSSGAPAFFPPFEWVADLWHEAKAAGCAVYFKPNTWPKVEGCGLPKEYPAAMTSD